MQGKKVWIVAIAIGAVIGAAVLWMRRDQSGSEPEAEPDYPPYVPGPYAPFTGAIGRSQPPAVPLPTAPPTPPPAKLPFFPIPSVPPRGVKPPPRSDDQIRIPTPVRKPLPTLVRNKLTQGY